MQLSSNDRVWAPENQPEYLLVLPSNQRPPKSRQEYLEAQAKLLARLIKESAPEQVQAQNRRLEEQLPEESLAWLHPDLLNHYKTPGSLLLNPSVESSPLHEWKKGADEAMLKPEMPQAQARQEAEALSLENFLGRVL